MALSPGTRLGTYEILNLLGAGGMGEVYRARDTRLGREVAVKALPSEVASSPDRLARFEREARTVAGLNHPNIVTLFSVEDEDGVRFLTMELIEGQSLDHCVTPGGLPLARILELSIPIADALVAAHERGVVHRDLKPGNVMVTRDGRVKVLDFGLAKVALETPTSDEPSPRTATAPISQMGLVVGTLPYMAPEQIRGESVDARTDLFALGVILYELSTGRRPFAGATPADLTSAILRDRPEPITNFRPDIPWGLERVADRCLGKRPQERFQTALDVLDGLRGLGRIQEHAGSAVPVTPAPESVPSVAVLPFVNRSASAEEEYFSDGLADEFTSMLAKIRGLRVAARSSAFYFKGKGATIAEIGSALNVATVLEGSIRKAGSRVRISVQLVKVASGHHIWSETYDRTLEDVFATQDEIAQSVVKELRTTLLGREADTDLTGQVRVEVARAAKGRGTDPEAHRLFLLARHLSDRWTHESVKQGIAYLKEALEIDPQFTIAWAELGAAYVREAGRGWVPASEGFRRAREAAERAIALEPDLSEGHALIGWIRMTYDWDWKGADASYQRALASAPGSARVLGLAGALAGTLGRHEEALALYHRAVERDPLSVPAHNNLGQELSAGGRFTEAERAYRRALEVAPQSAGTRAGLALTLLAHGRTKEALAEATLESVKWYRLWALSIIHHATGESAASDAALGELIETGANENAFQIAEVHAYRGDANAAFEWLERAYVQRDSGLAETKVNPYLRSLHEDPRWEGFLRKMGFEG